MCGKLGSKHMPFVTDQTNNMVMGAGSGSECTAAIPEEQDSTECSMHCPGELNHSCHALKLAS